MNKNETVLCIKKKLLPNSWTQPKSIVPLELKDFIKICSNTGFEFIHRPDAEKDASYKQIIPYIVLQTKNLEKTAIYNRQGSEQRLHDLWSLGIGGHINPIDQKAPDDPFKKILIAGLERELAEELEHRPQKDIINFSGIISEDATDVGKVHLGAVFKITTDAPEQFKPGPELFQFAWEKNKTAPST